jgi:IMP dehydrogenase
MSKQILLDNALCFDDVLLKPQYSDIPHRADIDISTSFYNRYQHITIDTPLVSANMDSVTDERMYWAMVEHGAFGYIHRLPAEERLALVESDPQPAVTIGICDDEVALGVKLVTRGLKHICVDAAHGDHRFMYEALHSLREAGGDDVLICAGNVCTREATQALKDCGANIVKVGIGPGSVCTTRIVTGHGYPQLSAIAQCAQVKDVFIIADGGCRHSSDIIKALAAGAHAVMSGFLFAGCQESAASHTSIEPGQMSKVYRGMASIQAQKYRQQKLRAPEGVVGTIPDAGRVAGVIARLHQEIQSGFSYSGARNIQELHERAEFVHVTRNSIKESEPRL